MKIPQILHVLRKDVRHHWIEILLCQLALLAYCWVQVRGWKEQTFNFTILTQFIVMLLPLTWYLFVFRVVQSESLVGDRQFWVTRPYEWKKLLAEKTLLVLVCLNLPMLIGGAILLAKAGFSPAPYLLGLLWMQVLLLQLPFLPLLALASVTRNLAQGALALVVVLLVVLGNSVFHLAFDVAHSYTMYTAVALSLPSRRSDWLEDLVLPLVCLAAVVLQYAGRKTAQSRLWLAGGALAMVTIGVMTSYARRNRDPFPAPAHQTIAFQAALNPMKVVAPKVPPEKGEYVVFAFPLRASGLPTGSVGWVRGIRIALETPSGFEWHGGSGLVGLLRSGENRWWASFAMEQEAYELLKSAPLRVRVTVAAEVFHEHDFEDVTATGGEFDVPRVGRCRIAERDDRTLRCNSPLVRPSMVVARVDPALSTCPDWEETPEVPLDGLPYAWLPRRKSELAEYGISPVVLSYFSFQSFAGRTRICPGTPLTFSFPEFVEDVRSDFEIENVNLDEYRRVAYRSEGITGANGATLGLPPLR
jgi:hypothetical protein